MNDSQRTKKNRSIVISHVNGAYRVELNGRDPIIA